MRSGPRWAPHKYKISILFYHSLLIDLNLYFLYYYLALRHPFHHQKCQLKINFVIPVINVTMVILTVIFIFYISINKNIEK